MFIEVITLGYTNYQFWFIHCHF